MIIERYDVILDQSKRAYLYNHLNNYTKSKYMLPATSARDQVIISFSLHLIGWETGVTQFL